MERGTVFSNVRNKLLAVLKDSFVGREPATVGYDDVARFTHTSMDGSRNLRHGVSCSCHA
jgi:hypothetical protein